MRLRCDESCQISERKMNVSFHHARTEAMPSSTALRSSAESRTLYWAFSIEIADALDSAQAGIPSPRHQAGDHFVTRPRLREDSGFWLREGSASQRDSIGSNGGSEHRLSPLCSSRKCEHAQFCWCAGNARGRCCDVHCSRRHACCYAAMKHRNDAAICTVI